MQSVGVYEIKAQLSALLRRVGSGETVEITRNRTPIARLVPIDPRQEPKQQEPLS